MSPVWSLVGGVDEASLLVGGLLGEQWLSLLPPGLEDGAHSGDLLPGNRDADLSGVDAHGAKDPVAAQGVPGLPGEVGGDPAAAACAGTRLPDGGEAIVVLERPEGHGGLAGVTDQGDDVGIEGAVAEGGYGEVLDVRGDDVVIVDEASSARGGRAKYTEAGA